MYYFVQATLSETETLLKYISKYYFRGPDGKPLYNPTDSVTPLTNLSSPLIGASQLDGLAMMAVNISENGDGDVLMSSELDDREDYFRQVAGCSATHMLEVSNGGSTAIPGILDYGFIATF